jgi:hypothetical protein
MFGKPLIRDGLIFGGKTNSPVVDADVVDEAGEEGAEGKSAADAEISHS